MTKRAMVQRVWSHLMDRSPEQPGSIVGRLNQALWELFPSHRGKNMAKRKGFSYRFTGLKGAQASALLMGQWVAYGPTSDTPGCALFAGVPEAAADGICPDVGPWMVPADGGIHLTRVETQEGIADIIAEVEGGRQRLFALIDQHV